MFLMGPLAQFKKMFEKGRIVATSLYFGAMFLTLWMAIKVQQHALIVSPDREPSSDVVRLD